MISIDDHPPPDPSSSHHHQHQQEEISHDLKLSDIDLKSPDADLDDTNNPTPNFSLRDYVFSLRSKDVACNWPFSHRSLQLCLKHGVKNLLPPFQSLDLLRDNSSLSKYSLENRLPNEEFISSFDGKSTEKRALGYVSRNSSGSKRDNESQSHFQEHLAHTRSKEKPPASSQKTENIRKSRLVMKLNSGVEPVGEVAPNSFIVSETMASKVCPVCKIFTSSSNTTLNAHIDQCLTGEGNRKWTDNPKVIVKHRIKPRKTRLMLDIYETAPHCTVEELDRRNGTSWATNSSFPDQEFKYHGEEDKDDKEDKEEPRMNTINPGIADNKGDVYIDNNGTKVRILSVPKAGSSDDHRAQNLLKGVKGSKVVMGKKKSNSFKQKHHQKYLKLSHNARMLCSPKPQARNSQKEEVLIAENCSKDERVRDPVNVQVHTKVADMAIVRPPWACSKRTDLAKKLSGKHQKLELESRATKDLLIESDKSSSRCNLGTPQSLSSNEAYSKSRKKLRNSSLLMGQQALTSNIMAEFRKESTRMRDDCEDPPDSSPSHHSDGADFRSKGGKLSYLRKNFSFSEAKLTTLKRKFSSVKKSRVLHLLNEKSVDEPSQDSFKVQSRMEEHTTSSRRKEETRSITSKSSTEESVDALPDVKSIRNETLSNLEPVCVVPGSFVCLSNSFDPVFSKQECVELYQDPALCSTNRAPDDVEKHENYFQEVDPIPIPGPPGSFLPSPGGETVSEEQHQENSSLTATTRVLSSEYHNHHDVIDRDSMSTSPVSDVSNPSLARSDSRSSEKLAYRSTSVDATHKKSLPNGDTSIKNDQPCCCSRKEANGGFRNFDQAGLLVKEGSYSYAIASNYQDTSILRKQVDESNVSPSGLNFRPEMFSLSSYPTSLASEKPAIFPTIKVPAYGYCDSAASPSKPVLRLMGKNLTVVKTDEDASSSSQQFKPPQSSQHHPQRPVIFSQYQNGSKSQNFIVYPHIDTRNVVDLRPSHVGYMPMVDRYGHSGPYLGPAMPQARSHHAYNNGASGSKPVKETVVIDDSSENEGDDSVRKGFVGRNWGQMNPLYTMYQHPYSGGGSSVFHGGGFQTSLANGDLGKWKPSRSTSHLRYSTPYNPPSYP